MEYGQKLTLDDITCPHCGGKITGEALCKHCQEHVIYGEAKAQMLEQEGYSIDPTHRTEEAFKEWYLENARQNSKFYKAGKVLSEGGKGIEEGSKAISNFGSSLLWMTLILFIFGAFLLLIL